MEANGRGRIELLKSENGGGKSKVRVMKVYYERLTDQEEIALSEAVEKITCPENSDECEHDCRLHFITWQNVVEEED